MHKQKAETGLRSRDTNSTLGFLMMTMVPPQFKRTGCLMPKKLLRLFTGGFITNKLCCGQLLVFKGTQQTRLRINDKPWCGRG